MKTYIQPGDIITVAAPTGGVTGVAAIHDAAAGEDVALQTTGVIAMAKVAGALTVDATSHNVTATATGNALARVRLNGAF